jgi:hypothetical protein
MPEMARIVDDFPKGKYHAQYDWNAWFDGQVRELVQGEDFFTMPRYFYSLIGQMAKKRKVHVIAQVHGDKVYLKAVR